MFKTMEMGLYKMLCFVNSRFEIGVFKMNQFSQANQVQTKMIESSVNFKPATETPKVYEEYIGGGETYSVNWKY